MAGYTVTGPEADMATWTLSGDDAGDFRVSSAGVLTFYTAAVYESAADADGDNQYMVTVKANDDTYTVEHMVTVMVTDEDELGRLSGDASVRYMENDMSTVATYMTDGPVDAACRWRAPTPATSTSAATGCSPSVSAPYYE